MKKTLIALAAVAAAGAASAQSQVALFGIVDIAVQYGTGEANDRLGMTANNYNASRIGFRGTEDLGGGLSAGFWLEAGFQPDDGTGQASSVNNLVNTTVGGLSFNRRSTISLTGGFGEIRVGRDILPYFWNNTTFDPFGGLGVGASQAYVGGYLGAFAGASTNVRASNSIHYFLPRNIGGFYGQAAYFMGESMQTGGVTEDDGSGYGVRLGYAAGPFDIAAAYGNSELSTGDITAWNVGGSWNFGMAKAFAYYTFVENDTAAREGTGWLIGASAPVGTGEIRAAYSQSELEGVGTAPTAQKIALGYVHNLSKRTAIYTNVAHVRNDDGGTTALAGASNVGFANENSTGFDIGIRHAF